MRKLIRNWQELAEFPKESATHILEIDVERCCGWITPKEPRPYKRKLSFMRQIKHLPVYLSTHTFYGKTYKWSGKVLRACGFDVDIDNWDKEG